MRILFLGDIVGRAARKAIAERLPQLRSQLRLDFVIANGENAAGGFGITEKICNELFDAGIDAITTGNHVWDQKEVIPFIDKEPRLLRPANYPPTTPGNGWGLYECAAGRVGLLNLMGRLFMPPSVDNPFQTAEIALKTLKDADAVIVDMHAEATSEKTAMGVFCDGRAALVVGTHTHVPTADTRILPKGTAYQTDLGMCGDYTSIIGMETDTALEKFLTPIPTARLTPAQRDVTLCGVFLETKDRIAQHIAPLQIGGTLQTLMPNV